MVAMVVLTGGTGMHEHDKCMINAIENDRIILTVLIKNCMYMYDYDV